jgi:Predicted hydrolases or acyltransferases (alpha/beta hydrolase superfamily)
MNRITTKDGTRIFYKDWGKGQPILFSHGWPLSSDAWDSQMLFFGSQGYRVVAHDRRGHGRSDQPWDGNDMDTYADDLAELIKGLDLRNVVLVGHSTGGGEVAHYIGRHGSERVSKVVLVGAVPPIMLKSQGHLDGVPMEVFDGIRAGVAANRSQFYQDLASGPFFGFNRPGADKSQGLIDGFWQQGMAGGIKGQYDCIKQFSEVDYTDDLKKIDVPTLFIHGDDDQIVPISGAARLAVKLVEGAVLKEYPEGGHGLPATHSEQFNRDVLEFIRA